MSHKSSSHKSLDPVEAKTGWVFAGVLQRDFVCLKDMTFPNPDMS